MTSSQDERPTLEDVAAFAGVSRSTASRALNGDANVSSRARDAVLAAARDLGYSPNQAARSLVTRRTGAVAVVLSEPEEVVLSDPYRTAVMRAGYRELAASGSQMVLMFNDGRDDHARTLRFLEGGHVDGALVFAPHKADPLPRALRLLRIPIVYGGQPGNITRGVHVVDFDNCDGARLAVEHLMDSGRLQIATVAGPQDQTAAVHRLEGWRKTLIRAGMSGLSEEADFTFEGGRAAMTRLLKRDPFLNGVFVASDLMAAGALRALHEAGRRVPDDVAVIGFDDHPALATAMHPPLTTVHQDPAAQVQHMVATLMALLAGETVRPQRHVLPVSLRLRESA
ncbi:DNA-binding LacI/PurR family transcriptional regulator [Amycolatopsis bartoniae]|uniref:LacI family transcriptional regulator n=1 Tax=Amycolatopsis bartoniae TaxID=941986 RepID=A0A8H9M648_9PSEU|nr:LacI family DNA-binding transcriptional regulator [Amycolatopsis bartoniae]MBB2935836.1 DNA-binding LacI/PurR family transcriptional regulator [Amycolatopsis bartoniae]TVT04974.1 LacI family transcriptional regulator [Amycolatopsis bartoniae]GHF62195.1 LacI family transcriptional regulator [Amycolatopsis bartoniae]